MRGGKRTGAGRKPRYGALDTKRYVRLIPIAWIALLDEYLAQLAKNDYD